MKLKILAIVALGVVGRRSRVRGRSAGSRPARRRRPSYLTGAVTTGDVTDEVAATGLGGGERVVWRRLRLAGPPRRCDAAATAARRRGGSTSVKVKVGDTVKKGAVLATADTTDLKRQLADANAA